VAARSFSGPLPPPEILAGYEQIVPGAANRILTLLEHQTAHRQQLESVVIRGNVDAQKRGQWMAYSTGLMVLAAAVGLMLAGKAEVGAWVLFGDLLVFAGMFVLGKKSQQKERAEKRDAMDHA
jgi:uncharacterized membrane protein